MRTWWWWTHTPSRVPGLCALSCQPSKSKDCINLKTPLYFYAYSETWNIWLWMQMHIFIHERLPLADAWRMNAENTSVCTNVHPCHWHLIQKAKRGCQHFSFFWGSLVLLHTWRWTVYVAFLFIFSFFYVTGEMAPAFTDQICQSPQEKLTCPLASWVVMQYLEKCESLENSTPASVS